MNAPRKSNPGRHALAAKPGAQATGESGNPSSKRRGFALARRLRSGLGGFSLAIIFLLPACAWLERRKEPDLLKVSRREERRFRAPARLWKYDGYLTPKDCWQVHTTLQGRESLIDGNLDTVAASIAPCQISQWIMLDLGEECRFQQIIQQHRDSEGFPRRYRIDVAGREGFPYKLVFLGGGAQGQSVAIFHKPVHARFIRITAIADEPQPWSVSELMLE